MCVTLIRAIWFIFSHPTHWGFLNFKNKSLDFYFTELDSALKSHCRLLKTLCSLGVRQVASGQKIKTDVLMHGPERSICLRGRGCNLLSAGYNWAWQFSFSEHAQRDTLCMRGLYTACPPLYWPAPLELGTGTASPDNKHASPSIILPKLTFVWGFVLRVV